MSRWSNDAEDDCRQDRKLDESTYHSGYSTPPVVHQVGQELLRASRLRIDLSLEAEQIHRESLSRTMEAIRASLLRIGRTDKLIEEIWTGQPRSGP